MILVYHLKALCNCDVNVNCIIVTLVMDESDPLSNSLNVTPVKSCKLLTAVTPVFASCSRSDEGECSPSPNRRKRFQPKSLQLSPSPLRSSIQTSPTTHLAPPSESITQSRQLEDQFDVYDDVLVADNLYKTQQKEERLHALELEVKQLKEVNSQLTASVSMERQRNDRRAEQIHDLLITSRTQVNTLNERIAKLQDECNFATSQGCCNCGKTKTLDRPHYVKVIASTNTVEVKFQDEKSLSAWITSAGLRYNRDGLATLSADLDNYQQKRHIPATLKSTGSILAQAK